METIETQANERERDKKTILYKKQLRKLLPKNSWFSAGCYTTLNDLTRKDLETILKIALIEANKQQRKTIRSSDIRTAHKELGKLNSGDFIEKIETAINSKIREIRGIEKQKKEVLLNGN